MLLYSDLYGKFDKMLIEKIDNLLFEKIDHSLLKNLVGSLDLTAQEFVDPTVEILDARKEASGTLSNAKDRVCV